jgi:fluoride exporter
MNGLNDLFAVAAGGIVGASLRHLISTANSATLGFHPSVATTLANVLGCLAIGAMLSVSQDNAPTWWTPRVSLACRVGVIGSLTTFSTFIAETVALYGEARYGAVAAYLACNLILGTAVFLIALRCCRAAMGGV